MRKQVIFINQLSDFIAVLIRSIRFWRFVKDGQQSPPLELLDEQPPRLPAMARPVVAQTTTARSPLHADPPVSKNMPEKYWAASVPRRTVPSQSDRGAHSRNLAT